MSRPPNEKRRPLQKGGVGPQLAGDRSKTQYSENSPSAIAPIACRNTLRALPANDATPNQIEAVYRAAASIHFPNMDEVTMAVRIRLMAQRDRAGAALHRCCPEAINTLAEANRLAALAALSGVPTRTLAFVSSAVDSLIFAAEQLHRGQV